MEIFALKNYTVKNIRKNEITIFALGRSTAFRRNGEEVGIDVPLQAVREFRTKVVRALDGSAVHSQVLAAVAHSNAAVVEFLSHIVSLPFEFALGTRRLHDI